MATLAPVIPLRAPSPSWPEDEIAYRTGLTRAQVDAAIAGYCDAVRARLIAARCGISEAKAAAAIARYCAAILSAVPS